LADHMEPSDIVVYWPRVYRPEVWERTMATPLRFYLDRNIPYSGMIKHYGALSPDDVRCLAREHPHSTLWIVTCTKKPKHVEALDAFGPLVRVFSIYRLRVLGAPTTNLIREGGFENEALERVLPNEAVLTEKAQAFDGNHALRIEVAKPATAYVSLPVAPLPYPVRNSSFDVWERGQPLGWAVTEGDGAYVVRESGAPVSRSALAFKSSPHPVLVEQKLMVPPAPGSVVVLQAQGKAPDKDQLKLILSYAIDGKVVRIEAAHPGGEDWAPMALRHQIPPEAAAHSVAVGIWHQGNVPGGALVSAITLARAPNGATLDPNLDYTLSMYVKCAKKKRRASDARAALGGKKSDGEDFHAPLLHFRGTGEWERYVVKFRPGREFPFGITDLGVRIGLYESVGALWVDNVQLEAHDHPTPFTSGTRLPHDEFFPELEIVVNDGAGVRNGGFEQWSEGKPLHWTFPKNHGRRHLKSTEYVKGGRYALKMTGGYTYTKLTCPMQVSGLLPGQTIALSAWAKSGDPKSTYVAIKPEGRHDKGVYSGHCPTDGRWCRLEAFYTVPREGAPCSFRLELNHRQEPKHPCYYDDVTIEVRD